MKRFLVVLAILVVLLGVMLYFAPQPFRRYIAYFPSEATVCVYCRSTSLDAQDMGNGFLVQCSANNLSETLQQCAVVDGISVKFAATQQEFLRLQQLFRLRVCSAQNIDDLQIVCGHSNKICHGIWLDGANINLQMAFDGQTVTVGCPLILDSY